MSYKTGIELHEYHQRKFKKCPFCIKECKRNIANGRNKGHYRTCGSIDCIRAAKNRPEVVAKKTHRGSSNPNWIHDRTKVKFQRSRIELKWWREEIFRRDNYVCQECGKRGGRLQAHHKKSYALFPNLRFDISNGEALCEDCHKKTSSYCRSLEVQFARSF